MAGRMHDLAMYQGQGTFSGKHKNGTPRTHWKEKLLKLELCADVPQLPSRMQLQRQASKNTCLGQLVDALCSAETLEQDEISWAQQEDKLMSLEITKPNHI